METVLAIFILGLIFSSASFFLKNLGYLYTRGRSRFLAVNLAAYELEKIRGEDFQNILSFKTTDYPADNWSQKISRAILPGSGGEVLVEELIPGLKKVTAAVVYKINGRDEKAALETLVAR